jgi:D-lactate dehydrogenase
MEIAFFEVAGNDKSFFEKHLAHHSLSFYKEPLKLENCALAEKAQIISVFIGSRLDSNLLSKLPHLKGIATRSTGTDHLDTDFCKQQKIVVASVPTYGVNTVAEHTFALILSLSRKIPQSAIQTKQGNFANKGLKGFDLAGKTIGIIGLGNIGRRVCELALAFKMKVLVHTRTPKTIDKVRFVDLETLLAKSHIITLHTPLTPNTKHILNSENINQIKKGALLINTARGGLIETRAITKALQEGTLAGAALDVLEEEQAIKDEREILTDEYIELSSAKTLLLNHVLQDMPNVIITPHNAFNSREALLEINQITLENVLSIAK